ncbi:MAG: hypothetical protein JWQ23_3374, partial [Herminiimonas sp.]|nr:hypothetical protein [Herminiimonas sp.]
MLSSDRLGKIATSKKKIAESDVEAAISNHACIRLPLEKRGLAVQRGRWKKIVIAAVRSAEWRILHCPFERLVHGQFHKMAAPVLEAIASAYQPGRRIYLSIKNSELSSKDGATLVGAL